MDIWQQEQWLDQRWVSMLGSWLAFIPPFTLLRFYTLTQCVDTWVAIGWGWSSCLNGYWALLLWDRFSLPGLWPTGQCILHFIYGTICIFHLGPFLFLQYRSLGMPDYSASLLLFRATPKYSPSLVGTMHTRITHFQPGQYMPKRTFSFSIIKS